MKDVITVSRTFVYSSYRYYYVLLIFIIIYIKNKKSS